MNHHDKTYYYNLIKGRIAENITEEMFTKLGFTIEKFGFENQMPKMSSYLRKFNNTATVQHLRHMPDFVYFKDGMYPQFLEVKFRHNSRLALKDVTKYTGYPGTSLLVFDNDNIFSFRHSGEQQEYINDLPLLISDSVFQFTDAEKVIIDSFRNVAQTIYKHLPKEMDKNSELESVV